MVSPKYALVQGHEMRLDRMDSLNLSISGIYEPFQTSLVEQWIKPGDIVLDIGANIGYYTLIFARLAGTNGHIYAFEPEPNSFNILSENVAGNHYTNITLFQKAVSSEDRKVRFFSDPYSNLDHRLYPYNKKERGMSVDAVRLDSLPEFLDTKINFIKMDIQGAEYAALKGMTHLLENNPRVILICEFWPSGLEKFGTPPQDLFTLLIDLGFELREIDEMEKTLTPVTSLSELLARCSNKPYYTNLACLKGYVEA
jgi:FkbM family methyltransferase